MEDLREELEQQVNAIPADAKVSLGVPLHVLLGEAVDLAAFVRRVWEPTDAHPGLSSAARRIDDRIGEDLLALVDAAQEQHTQFRLAAEPPTSREEVERGVEILDELTAVLQFHFDDGIDDERDAQLSAIDGLYGEHSTSDDALATALFDYASLAQEHRAVLGGLGGFDAALIDEARALSQVVRARSAQTPTERTEAARQHRVRRDQIVAVLDRQVKLVRAAARFAFRGVPQLVREAGSAYGRRARAAARRRKAAQDRQELATDTAAES
ncbi:MAG: hypothetical protein ACRBN8_08745 [Nannocystales bacterium]